MFTSRGVTPSIPVALSPLDQRSTMMNRMTEIGFSETVEHILARHKYNVLVSFVI